MWPWVYESRKACKGVKLLWVSLLVTLTKFMRLNLGRLNYSHLSPLPWLVVRCSQACDRICSSHGGQEAKRKALVFQCPQGTAST